MLRWERREDRQIEKEKDYNTDGLRGERNKQASRWCDGYDEEEGGMKGKQRVKRRGRVESLS